jgi:hypothetical protein
VAGDSGRVGALAFVERGLEGQLVQLELGVDRMLPGRAGWPAKT